MDNTYQKMKSMYDQDNARYCKVKLILKEPIVLSPFCSRRKYDQKYDENGNLVQWSIGRKPKKVYELYIKKSTNDIYCFSNKLNPRRVYPLWSLGIDDNKIESLEYIKDSRKEVTDWDVKNRNFIVNNTHENIWNDLVDDLKKDDFRDVGIIKENSSSKIKLVYIKKVFPSWVCNNVEDAILNKKQYSHRINGTKRDRSVSVEVGNDGKVRAWYSSEYSGCLNGDYYLLINKDVAVFYETD